MTRITNTTREVERNPLAALFTAGIPGAIEQSERQGQGELLKSDVLPSDIRSEGAFLALGFMFGDPVEGDPMFRAATLPMGWKREGSDHAMWSYLVDERGIKRVSIFYKAAFYDRSAHMSINDVGADLASAAIYSDDEPTAESLKLQLLTDAERASMAQYVAGRRARIVEDPRFHAKYEPRVAQLEALLSASRS